MPSKRRPTDPASPNRATVAERLHSAAIHLLRAVRNSDAESGLTAPRLSVLSVLAFGDRTITDLARAEQVKPPTMTRLIDGLVRGGLVARKTDPLDARVVRVSATRRGRAAFAAARKRRLTALANLLQSCDGEEVAALDRAAGLMEGLTNPPSH
jgi:DNA-binding MarR family transcriptional regulator